MELLFLYRLYRANLCSSPAQLNLTKSAPSGTNTRFLSQNYSLERNPHISAREFREKYFTQDTQHFCVASH